MRIRLALGSGHATDTGGPFLRMRSRLMRISFLESIYLGCSDQQLLIRELGLPLREVWRADGGVHYCGPSSLSGLYCGFFDKSGAREGEGEEAEIGGQRSLLRERREQMWTQMDADTEMGEERKRVERRGEERSGSGVERMGGVGVEGL